MEYLTKFLKEFQDIYVNISTDLTTIEEDLSKVELKSLEKYLANVNSQLSETATLTNKASKEALNHYLNILNTLDSKVDYISDSADVLNYVNTYFDIRTVKDMYNFDIASSSSDTCIYNPSTKNISLNNIKTINNCSKTINYNVMTFYNTNNSSHTGLYISSPHLYLLEITQILIRKSDGTVLEVEIPSYTTELIIEHEELISSQVNITFDININTEYLSNVLMSLITNKFITEGNLALERSMLKASDLFSIVVDASTPSNTYCNVVLNMELKDINDNSILQLVNTIPVNGSLVCKRLDNVNYEEVDTISSLVIQGLHVTTNLSIEYLQSLKNKNDKYLLYIPKDKLSTKANKLLTKLGTFSYKVNNDSVDKILVTPTIELYTFNTNFSPKIRHIAGVINNETI